MKSVTKLALLACLGLTIAAAPRPAVADPVSARLDALERENAALRARLNRLETSTAVKPQPRPADAGPVAPLAALPRAPAADSMASAPRYAGEPRRVVPSFELSGSLSFLQPGAGNLEYGTLTNPLPVVTPHWNNQSLKPNFAPSFTPRRPLHAERVHRHPVELDAPEQHRQGLRFSLRRPRWWDRPI